jgi:hypothetical protein
LRSAGRLCNRRLHEPCHFRGVSGTQRRPRIVYAYVSCIRPARNTVLCNANTYCNTDCNADRNADFYAITYAITYADSHPYAHHYANNPTNNANTYAHGDSDCHGHSNSNRDADCNGNGHSNTDSEPDCYTYGDSNCNRDSYSYAHGHPNCHADSDSNGNSDCNSNAYAIDRSGGNAHPAARIDIYFVDSHLHVERRQRDQLYSLSRQRTKQGRHLQFGPDNGALGNGQQYPY